MKPFPVVTAVLLVCVLCGSTSKRFDRHMLKGAFDHAEELGRVKHFAVLKGTTLDGNAVQYTLIDTENQHVWSVTPTSISMNWTVNVGATMFFDHTNNILTRMVVNLVSPEGRRFMLVDYNGDGVPDVRIFVSDGRSQIFFQGEFFDCTGFGRQRTVRVGDRDVLFRFDGNSWRRENAK